MTRPITHKGKVDFLTRYQQLYGFIVDCAFAEEVCAPCRATLVRVARVDLGFSKKTTSGDIFTALKIAWKKRGSDGRS